MKKLKKRKVTLDGMIGGSKLEGSVEIKGSEASKVKRVLMKAGAVAEEQRLYINVYGLEANGERGSGLEISLTKDYRKKDAFFLNIKGNPVAYLTGSNVYGFAEADTMIRICFMRAIKQIEASADLEMPIRIKNQIQASEIYLHTLEFATYTNKIKDKQALLEDWAFAYRIGHSIGDEGRETLLDLLDLKWDRKHKDHRSSVCLRIMSSDGREEQAMLMAYDKAKQMKDSGLEAVPSDIKNRIRLDLNLNYGWFRSHRVDGRKLQTLADLSEYVAKNFGGRWYRWLAAEFNWALDRTLLFYLWSFDYKAVLDGRYPEYKANKRVDSRVYMALMRARTLQDLPDREFAKLWRAESLGKLNLNPHPYEIRLDMGAVE